MKWPLFLQLAHDDEEHSSPKKYAMPEDLIPVLKVGIGRLWKFLGNNNFNFCAINLYFINIFYFVNYAEISQKSPKICQKKHNFVNFGVMMGRKLTKLSKVTLNKPKI